jgi:hypothetical protein
VSSQYGREGGGGEGGPLSIILLLFVLVRPVRCLVRGEGRGVSD